MRAVLVWIAKFLKWSVVAVVAAVVISLLAYNGYAHWVRRSLDPPGRMVDIGTHRMHLHCEGTGIPTVVMDAGGMMFSVTWAPIMDEVKAVTRVCAFDRSGLGWSDSVTSPPTVENRQRDLEALLAASGESAPYIFVGHSLGGMFAWLYAQNHLGDAAGLIAVDSVPRAMPSINESVERPTSILRVVDALGLTPVLVRLSFPFDPELYTRYPNWAVEVMRKQHFLLDGGVDEILRLDEYDAAAEGMANLGDLPLIVIVHGRPGDLFAYLGDGAEGGEKKWQESQLAMSRLSSDGRLVLADQSDHFVTVRQPDIIVDAIRELVEQYRAHR